MTTISNHTALTYTTALPYNPRMHSVAETSIFTRRADALLSREDRAAMIGAIAADPQGGDLIQGLGGIRKRRFAPEGRGKSGAFRVIFYYAAADLPVLALLIYGKNEQADISSDQRRAILRLIEDFKARRGLQKGSTGHHGSGRQGQRPRG